MATPRPTSAIRNCTMIDTFVMYVSTHTRLNVLRIDAIAITIGMSTAGSVPKTKKRITSEPRPPISASVRTLGPVPPPDEASWIASRPVSHDWTPAGVFDFNAARTCSRCTDELKLGVPGG
jgi:hypothetical protein